jgi:hypothetical protein
MIHSKIMGKNENENKIMGVPFQKIGMPSLIAQ